MKNFHHRWENCEKGKPLYWNFKSKRRRIFSFRKIHFVI